MLAMGGDGKVIDVPGREKRGEADSYLVQMHDGRAFWLEDLPEEEQRKTLTNEIRIFMEEFGPVKKQILILWFTERHLTVLLECLASMERTGKIFKSDEPGLEDYYVRDTRLFEHETFGMYDKGGQLNTFETIKRFKQFWRKQDLRQQAFAVFLQFRTELDAERWFWADDYKRPWLLLSLTARDQTFWVYKIDDDKWYNELYASDSAKNKHDVCNRIFLVDDDDEKQAVCDHEVKGVKAFATVDVNYEVKLKKP